MQTAKTRMTPYYHQRHLAYRTTAEPLNVVKETLRASMPNVTRVTKKNPATRQAHIVREAAHPCMLPAYKHRISDALRRSLCRQPMRLNTGIDPLLMYRRLMCASGPDWAHMELRTNSPERRLYFFLSRRGPCTCLQLDSNWLLLSGSLGLRLQPATCPIKGQHGRMEREGSEKILANFQSVAYLNYSIYVSARDSIHDSQTRLTPERLCLV